MLSIIVITKDTRELLQQLLKSIEQDLSLKPSIKDIIVIDNASSDGTDEMVRNKFPGVMYVRNDKNKGFAVAVNQGVSHSSGGYILLLNSDTLLIPGEMIKMLNFMEENKDVGICGPQLVYPNMKPQRSFAYPPSLLSEILPRFFFRSRSVMPSQHPASSISPSAVDVPSLIGAAIMIRKTVFDKLSGFDERFFFFLEETDFCLCAKHSGYRVMLLPDVKIIHLQGKTVGQKWVKGRIEYNISLYKFIKKHHNTIYCRYFQAIRFFKSFFVVFVLSCLPFLLIGKRTQRSYTYYRHLLLWHLSGRPDNAGLRS